MVIFHSYVSLPEGMGKSGTLLGMMTMDLGSWLRWSPPLGTPLAIFHVAIVFGPISRWLNYQRVDLEGQRAAVAVGQAITQATRKGCNSYGEVMRNDAKCLKILRENHGKPPESSASENHFPYFPNFNGHDWGGIPIFRHIHTDDAWWCMCHGEKLDFPQDQGHWEL